MPLVNFGAILNFAEELERLDSEFYRAASARASCEAQGELFKQFIGDAEKNIKIVRRTRRENVTEMILEGIKDFHRAPFQIEGAGADAAAGKGIPEKARRLEQRAEKYYREAAEKIKALSEVARALKQIGKKHAAHLKALDALET
jgi:rubrerythrin